MCDVSPRARAGFPIRLVDKAFEIQYAISLAGPDGVLDRAKDHRAAIVAATRHPSIRWPYQVDTSVRSATHSR